MRFEVAFATPHDLAPRSDPRHRDPGSGGRAGGVDPDGFTGHHGLGPGEGGGFGEHRCVHRPSLSKVIEAVLYTYRCTVVYMARTNIELDEIRATRADLLK